MISFPIPESALPLRSFMAWLEELQRFYAAPLAPRAVPPHLKQEIQELAALFSVLVWSQVEERIQEYPETLGFGVIEEEQLVPLSPAYIEEDLKRMWERSSEFPISRLRAWSSRVLEYTVHDLLGGEEPKILLSSDTPVVEAFLRYRELLAGTRNYWFRRTPAEHIGTGFHTALSACYRMLGAAGGLFLAARDELPQKSEGPRHYLGELTQQFLEVAQYTATAHLVMLPVLDGIVWDSAGSTPLRQFDRDSRQGPLVKREVLQLIVERARTAPWDAPREPRTGCPALRGREAGQTIIRAVITWCRAATERWYWPQLIGSSKLDPYGDCQKS